MPYIKIIVPSWHLSHTALTSMSCDGDLPPANYDTFYASSLEYRHTLYYRGQIFMCPACHAIS